jgi:hypothetical protein
MTQNSNCKYRKIKERTNEGGGGMSEWPANRQSTKMACQWVNPFTIG